MKKTLKAVISFFSLNIKLKKDLIQKVIKHMPGKPSCLKESIIVHLYFKRKGLNIPLYLGVSSEIEFLAHAWYDQNSSNGFCRLNGS